MPLATIDFILIIAYFAAMIVIGYIASRKESAEDYLIAERKLGVWSSMATINASKTGSIMMAFVALVYLWGFSALWYFIGMVAGVFLFIPFAAKLKRNSQQRFYTLADYFRHNYGKRAGTLASLITIVLMFGLLVLNLIAGSKIFVFFTSWPFWICAIISVAIVLIYIMLGGFKAVVRTDFIQYLAMIFILIALTLTMFNGSLIPASEWNFFNATVPTMVGFFIVGMLYPFGTADMWRRVYSAKDANTVKKSIALSGVVYAFVGFLLALVALTVKTKFPTVDPDLALIHGFGNLLPAGLVGLAVVLLFAAIMSSIDTYIFTCSSAIVQDFTYLTKKSTVKRIKQVMLIVSIIALLIAILVHNLVIGSFIFVSFLVIIGVAAITTWIRKEIKQMALVWGFVVGLIGLVAFIIQMMLAGEITTMVVIAALGSSILGLIIGGVISFFKSNS
ncbi:sodium:solute symporter family protein [Candidatus Woesearchaeota archaeon]|nr:sodium:solute symporter family protein [Candidatus Woesearchaeota archaeon]